MASALEDGTKHQVEVELVESQQVNGSNNMKQDPTAPGIEFHEPRQADPHDHHNHNQKLQSFCAGCSGPIRDKFIFSVIDLYWHQDCVKCADCMQNLSDRCYTFEGKLYCRQDYWHRFGPRCYECQESIDQSELVQRIKGNRVYHLKCFTCNECHRQLEQGEQLHLIDDKKLICRQDFQRISHTANNNLAASNGCTTTNSKNGFTSHETQSSYFTLLSSSSSTPPKSLAIESLKHRSSLTSLDNKHDLNKEDGEDGGGVMMVPDMDLADDSADERENNKNNSRHLDGDEENRLAGIDLTGLAGDTQDLNNTAGDSSLNSGHPNQTTKINTTKQSQANAIKRKRRRKQRLMAEDKQLAGKVSKEAKATSKLLLAAANRNGESILNGGPAGGATTILAHEKMDQQISCSSSSSASTTSSSSSHSTSSNSTSSQRQQDGGGGGSSGAHHHHHQQQNHHHLHHHHHHHHNQSSAGGGGGGGNGGNGAGHKPTRVRTVLNEKQLQTLRDCYANNPRPDALMKEQLVDMTGLSSRVIRVWFQNKRCKDKKKSILYKQMQQHEKDGRHLAGLTHIRGVPMVAASPIHYLDEHSPAAATPPPPPPATAGTNPGSEPDQTAAITSVQSPQLIQQQQANAADNTQAGHQAIDIHAYQPPWKGLANYAQQHQQGNPTGSGAPIDPASPRYQQLIGQIHGYAPPPPPQNEHQIGAAAAAAPEPQPQYSVAPPRPPTSAGGGGGVGSEPGPYSSQPLPGLMQPSMSSAHHHHHNHHHHHHNHHLGQPGLMAAASLDSGSLHMHQFQH